MKIAPIAKPSWARCSDETEDYSFEWAEWTECHEDTECTLHFRMESIEVDPIDPDDFARHVDALVFVGAEISLDGVTEYHDRKSVVDVIGAIAIDVIDERNLERAVMP